MKKLNPRLGRIVGFSTLIDFAVVLVIYIASGIIDVPSDSPLADQNYAIRVLNDVSVPYDVEITEAEMAAMPVNQLYGGEDWQLPMRGYIVIYIFLTLLLIRITSEERMFSAMALWFTAKIALLTEIARIAANICFCYDSLRAGAQTLIDNNHRLRVIAAYIGIWSQKYSRRAYGGIYAEDSAAVVLRQIQHSNIPTIYIALHLCIMQRIRIR